MYSNKGILFSNESECLTQQTLKEKQKATVTSFILRTLKDNSILHGKEILFVLHKTIKNARKYLP